MKYRGIELVKSKSSGLLSFRYDNKLYKGFWSIEEAKPKIDEIKQEEKARHRRTVRNSALMKKLIRLIDFGKSFEVEINVGDFVYTGGIKKIETKQLTQIRVVDDKILFSAVDRNGSKEN